MRCLSKELANKLKEAARRGEFDIEKMYEMPSKERKALFAKYLPEDESTFVNTQFERAMASARTDSLEEWAKATFIGKQETKLNAALKRVDELREKGLLSSTEEQKMMEDYVADKLGVSVSVEEVDEIIKYTDSLKKLGETKASLVVGGEEIALDIPNIEYFKEYKKFSDYIESLSPSPLYKLTVSSLFRTNLLLSPKSAITNIIGNTMNSITMSLARRVADNQWSYGGNGELVKSYLRLANKIFRETGYDISRMTDYSMGKKVWGEEIITSQGPGAVRKYNRIMEDIVFNKLMGVADAGFAQAHFADSAVINATKMARQKGLVGEDAVAEARKIILDSFSVEPRTSAGEAIREFAISEAEKSTYTDKTFFSDFGLGLRRVLNKIPGVRIGDWTMPFIKVPANALYRAIEGAGGAVPFDIYKLAKGFQEADPKQIRNAMQGLARAGMGITATVLLVEALDPENYIGEYEFTSPEERRLVELENGTYNAIKIGKKWISLDYFGPFATGLVGMMHAKKYGDGGVDTIAKYLKASAQQLTKIPGMSEMQEVFSDTNKALDSSVTVEEAVANATIGVFDMVANRVVPSIIGDVAASLDEYERKVERGTMEGVFETFLKKIPVAREKLDPKINMFAEEIETSPWWMQLSFGARMREGKDNAITNELNRLNAGGQLPSLSNVEYTSTRVKELASQIGEDKFKQALKWFGVEWKESMEELIDSKEYKKMTDEEKRNAINTGKTQALESMLKKYHYKKTKK